MLIEQQLSCGVPFHYCQCSYRIVRAVRFDHLAQVQISKDIHIHHNEQFIVFKKTGSFFQSAAGVKQFFPFVGDEHITAKAIMLRQYQLYLVGEMVYVYYHIIYIETLQVTYVMLKE